MTDLRTQNRNYPKPNGARLQDDLPRIQQAWDAVDQDVQNALNTATAANTAAGQASATASSANSAANSAAGQANAARLVVGVSPSDTSPGGLLSKIQPTLPLREAVNNAAGDERYVLSVDLASEAAPGVVEFANASETTALVADNLAVSPANLKLALQANSNVAKLPASNRTTTTTLLASDIGTYITCSGNNFTVNFSSAANLGPGWWVYLKNSGPGDITVSPATGQTIDGLTSYIIYPYETRLVQCNGTALTTTVTSTFTKHFTTSGNFIRPPGYAFFEIEMIGGGGGGAGGGTKFPNAEDIWGGGGGGGGAYFQRRVTASILSSSNTVTVGAGGAGGAGAALNSSQGSGALGSTGGTTAFAGLMQVPGGGGGRNSSGVGSANGGVGGTPLANSPETVFQGGISVPVGGPSYPPYYGGAGGGRSSDATGAATAGGRSVFGGHGGGGGGGADPNSNAWQTTSALAGSSGGSTWTGDTLTLGGGATAGSINTSAAGDGGAGSAGTTPQDAIRGSGGGGGGAGGRQGGDGGVGGRGAGGGGGAAGYNGRGGNGGAGGDGCVRISGIS